MKVMVVGGWAPSLLSFRGVLLEEMVARGHEVTACAAGDEPGEEPEVERELGRIGVTYRSVPLARASIDPRRDLHAVRALRRLCTEIRPDVLLAYTVKPVIYASLAARTAGVPSRNAIITGLGYAFGASNLKQRLVGGLVHVLYRAALSGARTVFFQNPDDLDLFLKRGLVRRHKTVLLNGSGVDLDHYKVSSPPSGPTTFLLIARLLNDKGIIEYVEAARRIKRERSDARFQLVGPFDPNPSGIDRAQVNAWEREGVVEYLGRSRDVRPHLANCHVYVLPSYREGTPRSVLEAMSTGRPIITTDAPGCRETVVEGSNGFLVPIRDPEALAGAMRRFLDDPALPARMGIASRRLAEAKYDVHKVNAVILDELGL